MRETMTFDMAQLEERVRAAARNLPAPDASDFRCLETRSRDRFDPKSGWMIPLKHGTRAVHAVELVRCDPDHPGAVLLQKNASDIEVRTTAQTLYELWVEELPPGSLE